MLNYIHVEQIKHWKLNNCLFILSLSLKNELSIARERHCEAERIPRAALGFHALRFLLTLVCWLNIWEQCSPWVLKGWILVYGSLRCLSKEGGGKGWISRESPARCFTLRGNYAGWRKHNPIDSRSLRALVRTPRDVHHIIFLSIVNQEGGSLNKHKVWSLSKTTWGPFFPSTYSWTGSAPFGVLSGWVFPAVHECFLSAIIIIPPRFG